MKNTPERVSELTWILIQMISMDWFFHPLSSSLLRWQLLNFASMIFLHLNNMQLGVEILYGVGIDVKVWVGILRARILSYLHGFRIHIRFNDVEVFND